MKKFAILFLLTYVLPGCEKVVYYPDDPISPGPTLSISHRGGRTAVMRENALSSIILALPHVDGIEVDIQISKDRTIWLSHNPKVKDCHGSRTCFTDTYDTEIAEITTCDGTEPRYTKLEDVMKYMDENNIRKYICIDLKGWIPCSIEALNVEGLMRLEADRVIELAKKYRLLEYLQFQTDVHTVLSWISAKEPEVQTFYVTYGHYEEGMLMALDKGFTGISWKSFFKDELNADKVSFLHKKGLRIHAWNIPDSAHAQQLRDIHCDFIQIDL